MANVSLIKCDSTMWITADKRYVVSVDRRYQGTQGRRAVHETTYTAVDMHNGQRPVAEAGTLADIKARLSAHIARSAA